MRGEREYISVRIIIPMQRVKGFSHKKWTGLTRDEKDKLNRSIKEAVIFGFGNTDIAHVDMQPVIVRKLEQYILDDLELRQTVEINSNTRTPCKLEMAVREKKEVTGVMLKSTEGKTRESARFVRPPTRNFPKADADLFGKENVNEKAEEATED